MDKLQSTMNETVQTTYGQLADRTEAWDFLQMEV